MKMKPFILVAFISMICNLNLNAKYYHLPIAEYFAKQIFIQMEKGKKGSIIYIPTHLNKIYAVIEWVLDSNKLYCRVGIAQKTTDDNVIPYRTNTVCKFKYNEDYTTTLDKFQHIKITRYIVDKLIYLQKDLMKK